MRLPHVLRIVAEAVGEEAALKLARDHGGTRLWIPLAPTSALEERVGAAVAAVLCATWQYEYLDVPLGPYGAANAARRLADRAIAEGRTAEEAARVSGLTERAIYKRMAKRRADADARQGRLFE